MDHNQADSFEFGHHTKQNDAVPAPLNGNKRPSFSLLRSLESDIAALQNLNQYLHDDIQALKQFDSFTERLLRCHHERNTIYVTGIGKSGIVAKRLASTLSSISIRSQVSPFKKQDTVRRELR